MNDHILMRHIKNSSKSAKKELNRIKRIYCIKKYSFLILMLCIILSILISYCCHKAENEFLCSLFLNIMGGLLTGLVITIWFRLNDNLAKDINYKKNTFMNNLNTYSFGIKRFKLSEWNKEDDYYSYDYNDPNNYLEKAFYTKEIINFKEKLLEHNENIARTSEYFQDSKELKNISENLLSIMNSTFHVIERYQIKEVLLTLPADTNSYERTMLQPKLLFLGKDTAIKENYIEIIQMINKVNEQIDMYNKELMQIISLYMDEIKNTEPKLDIPS